MAHYTRTHKSAARLQMHTPGWNQREHTCNGFLYTLHPDCDIHWPENRVPASTKIFHHLGSMGIQAWLLTIALFAPLSPVHSARWCSIPAMDTPLPHNSLLPSPASFSGQSPTRPTTTTPISTSSCVRSMNRVWGNWWTSGPGRHPRTPTGEKRLDDTRK